MELENKDKQEQELLDKIKELENINDDLQKQIRRLKYRGSFPLSIIILSLGALALLFSYIYEALILTFIGIALTIWGSVLFYALPVKFVSNKSLYGSIGSVNTLNNILENLNYKGKAIFLYPNTLRGIANGYIFIAKDNDQRLPSNELLAKERFMYEEGLLIPAHSKSIVKLFEEKYNTNLLLLNLEELFSKLEEFFVEDLRIVDNIKFHNDKNIITMVAEDANMAYICKNVNLHDKNNIGCYLCSSIALMISKVTNMPVIIENTSASNVKIKSVYRVLENGI